MYSGIRKKIIRLLGVGFDADDGHVRITSGDKFDVVMGSDESHEYMTSLIMKIEEELEAQGLELDELSTEKLNEIVQSLG
ncbi:MAG TPA: hypothetical protein VLL07_03165 [Pontiella sp.]|nr:hypothetical protein [Pontiella sp.]